MKSFLFGLLLFACPALADDGVKYSIVSTGELHGFSVTIDGQPGEYVPAKVDGQCQMIGTMNDNEVWIGTCGNTAFTSSANAEIPLIPLNSVSAGK